MTGKPDTVQQIKDKLSITEVVGQYVKLQRAGIHLRTKCPFHNEKSPSFYVSEERGTYHCFGCSVGGDMFSFVQAIEGVDFKGALKMLAEKAGVEVVYSGSNKEDKDDRERLGALIETATIFLQSKLSVDAKKYLHERGLSDATVSQFRIGEAGSGWDDLSKYLNEKGFSDKEMVDAGLSKKGDRGITDKFRNRIMFPISDVAGRVVAFSGRIFGPHASPEAPKYLNSPETPLFHKSKILYGYDKAKLSMRKLGAAVLVEGQVDLVMSHQAGWTNSVAVSGTAFTTDHALLIKRQTDNLVIALDADEAGIKAASRAARAALQMGLHVKVAQLPKDMDPADFILKEGEEAWKQQIKNAKDIITFLLDVLEERMPQRDKFRRAVEQAVIPFIKDVQSPIAREQYMGDVAKRLGVSEKAVAEVTDAIPSVPVPEEAKPVIEESPARADLLYGLLLILPEDQKDEKTAEVIREAIGEIIFEQLEASPDSKKEHLRFLAEREYSRGISGEGVRSIALVALKERLQKELSSLNKLLVLAEKAAKEEDVSTLLERAKQLTGRIAKLHEL